MKKKKYFIVGDRKYNVEDIQKIFDTRIPKHELELGDDGYEAPIDNTAN